MGKKMKLPSLFKAPDSTPTAAAATTTITWPWPSCVSPRTVSFRASAAGDIFKTVNSAYDTEEVADSGAGDVFKIINSAYDAAETEEAGGGEEAVEAVIRGVRAAERLFFEPGETSSIMGREAQNDDGPRPLVVAMDSMDPYVDFKRSMEEMVEAHGLKGCWNELEELLGWYLRANGKSNHGYIVGAFVDLLVDLDIGCDHENEQSCHSLTTSAYSLSSPLSFSSSTSSTSPTTCLSSLEGEDEIDKKVDDGL